MRDVLTLTFEICVDLGMRSLMVCFYPSCQIVLRGIASWRNTASVQPRPSPISRAHYSSFCIRNGRCEIEQEKHSTVMSMIGVKFGFESEVGTEQGILKIMLFLKI